MRLKPRSFLIHILLGALLALLPVLVLAMVQAQATAQAIDPSQFMSPLSSETKALLTPCLPELAQASEVHEFQTAIDQGIIYVTVQINLSTVLRDSLSDLEGGITPPEQQSWSATLSLDPANQCKVLLPKETPKPASWLELLPESVADQFALQDLQFQIKLFQALNQDPNQILGDRLETLAQSNGALYADQAWAFQQLGFTLPPTITIVDPTQQQPGVTP